MSDHEPNEDGLGRFIADLVERDVPSAEIDRRLDFSCDRIREIFATHGLPDTRAHAARHRASRVLSNRQARILAFIRDYTAVNSFSPSLREIAGGCDTSSTSVVNYNLRLLEKRGYLTRVPTISRTIVLTEKGRFETIG